MDILQGLIPKQNKGSKTNATAKLKVDSRHEAFLLFAQAKIRLLDINNWHTICGKTGADFKLTDASGNPLHSINPQKGNLIRIKLPAPQNRQGDGSDWVEIEKFIENKDIYKDVEVFGFRVRPVKDPFDKSKNTAHFFDETATSSFLVYREARNVYVMERGRNEIPNMSGSLLNKIRNLMISIPGMLGFSNSQWQKLVEGILYNQH